MTALQVQSLSHAYDGRPVLRQVDFILQRGQVGALLGPSGGGKTTLLRLVAGLEPLQAGRIRLFGHTVADAESGHAVPPEQRQVGLVFQDFALFPHLTVLDNILFGVPRGDDERRRWALRMLERVGLKERAGSWPHELSGGERQRVALLRALAPRPRLLLLDEPFSSLDAARRLDMREEALALIREEGITALLVTHDAQEAMFMADHLIVMHDGAIIQQGTPADIYERPASPFVLRLFGHINRFRSRVRADGTVPTPAGLLPAPPGMQAETAVEVYVRANAFHLMTEEEQMNKRRQLWQGRAPLCCLRGEVVSAHFMGVATHLHVRPHDAPDQLLHVQLSGSHLLPPGSAVVLAVDAAGAFIFPAAAAGS